MEQQQPSLEHLWESFTGYQRTAAIKAGIELDLFSLVAAGADTIEALAERTGARGLRPLANHLVMDGFLRRDGDRYTLTPTAAAFLDRNSPAYVGSAISFLASPIILDSFSRLTEAVRRGGTVVSEEGTLSEENPVWIDFARAMGPLAAFTGSLLANLLDASTARGWKVLDVAAGHGHIGLALAQANPTIEVTALDWGNVLSVAEENARTLGLSERLRTIPGSALSIPWGEDYDLVLLPNFLHHFDPPTCEEILRKARAALAPGGRLVIVEFVPDDDRSGPPDPVRFGLVMLASTPAGDAYTLAEYREMLRKAAFGAAAMHDLLPSPARVIIAGR